jgi:CRISPR-associated protein Cas2
MLTVFCYDIAESKVRARVAALLEERTVRVQDSVYECRMTRDVADRLFGRVAALLDPGDKLRMYAISQAGRERCRAHGGGPVSEDGDFWIV